MDKMIQLDLGDDEDFTVSRSNNDLGSVSSDGMNEVAFSQFYESATPCTVYDVDEPIQPCLEEMKKRLVSPNRRPLQQKKWEIAAFLRKGVVKKEEKLGNLVRQRSLGAKSSEDNQLTRRRDSPFRLMTQLMQRPIETREFRGQVEREKSSRTETTVLEEATENAPKVNIKVPMNESLSSICYLVEDDVSEVLADHCFDLLNDSVSAITNGKSDDDDDDSVSTITNGLCDLEEMINHSKHHRSVPIIDTKSMETMRDFVDSPRQKARSQSLSQYPYMKIDL